MNNKDIKLERECLIKETGLIWEGKNELKFDSNKPISLFISLIENILKLEYKIQHLYSRYTQKTHKHNGIAFFIKREIGIWPNKDYKQWQWYITVNIKPYKDNIIDLFKIINKYFTPNGITGTNEWKQDVCRDLKIPLVGKLKYLIPRWYNNRLDLHLRFLEKRFDRDIRTNFELSLVKKINIRKYFQKLELIKSVFPDGIFYEIKKKLIYDNKELVSYEFKEKIDKDWFI